ncbi:MAG: hypothetical protein AAF571_09000 [Verrucomicrobiota bacterium]
MKTDDQQLLLYWSGELQEPQLSEFEQSLKSSPELQRRLTELQQFQSLKPGLPSRDLVTGAITERLVDESVQPTVHYKDKRKKMKQGALLMALTALILLGFLHIFDGRGAGSPSQQIITSTTQDLKYRLQKPLSWAESFNQSAQPDAAKKKNYALGGAPAISNLRDRMSAARQRIQSDPI